MIEREPSIRPKVPDILKNPFVEGLHPYTMMFLYLSYQQGVYKKLNPLQREVFDRYFTDELTVEGQYDFIAKGSLEILIQKGFDTLRKGVTDEVREAFRENILPYFKESDYPFLRNEKDERIRRTNAKRSISNRGQVRSKEAKKRISEGKKRSWDPNTKKRHSQAMRDAYLRDRDYAKRVSDGLKKRWTEDNEYRLHMLEELRKAREKKSKKSKRKRKRIVI